MSLTNMSGLKNLDLVANQAQDSVGHANMSNPKHLELTISQA